MTADRLVLLRHGRTASNAQGRFQGQLDVPLDDAGLAQAKAAATALAAWLLSLDGPLRLASSDLLRAVQTAQPLADQLSVPMLLDADLRERSFGRWEGLLREQARALDPETFDRWTSGEDVAAGGGELLGATADRAGRALARLAGELDGGTLVVVGHGASGRSGLARLLELPGTTGRLDVMANCHYAVARRRGDRWLLVAYNHAPA